MTIPELILQVPLAAGALFIVYMFTAGKLHTDSEFQRVVREREEYKKTLETERKATTELAQQGAVTNQLLSAVVTLAADRRGVKVISATAEPPAPEEIGL